MEFRYRGLKGTLEHVEVTEKELDARLMQLQQQHPCVKTVTDRAAKAGDELVLDYAGYADGVQFPGGTARRSRSAAARSSPALKISSWAAAPATRCACM